MIPAEDAATIRAAYDRDALGEIDVAAIDAIEAVTKHDVIAFLTWAGEKLGPERRWLHQGMTSSDVLDTALAVQLEAGGRPAARRPRRAARGAEAPRIRAQADADDRPQPRHPRRADHLRAQARAGLCRVRAQPRAPGRGARRHRDLRHLRRGRHLRQHRSARSRSMSPPSSACAVEPISTQVIPRDRHAMFFATLGVIASSIERLATEIRHLQRTEVLEAEEYFSPGPEGQLGDAAQAQPGADREPDRPRAHGPRLRHAGAGECRAVARARHLATPRSSASSARTRRSRSTSRSRA